MKNFLAVTFCLVFMFTTAAVACNSGCPSHLKFSGNHYQGSASYIDHSTVRDGAVSDGAQSAAVQETSGKYKGKGPGFGVTGGIGGTISHATNTRHEAFAAGAAGNIAGSMVYGRRTCAKVNGSGAVQNVAVKGGAGAVSGGSFSYRGQVGSGAVVGAGGTAGFAHAVSHRNTAKSSAGQITASGITTSSGI